MATQSFLEIISQGVKFWNEWRENNLEIKIDLTRANLNGAFLSGINLNGVDLTKANLSGTNLTKANLIHANLIEANLREANLTGAYLTGADMKKADLSKANLSKAILNNVDLSVHNLQGVDLSEAHLIGANLQRAHLNEANLRGAYIMEANLNGANLTEADLTEAYLKRSSLVETNIEKAILKGCHIYGLSAWNLEGKPKDQSNLVITRKNESIITVDDLQVAQFIYQLLDRDRLRNVIDTITSKAVLILGRFTPERKSVLDAVADELRKNDLLPIMFDFEKPTSRDFTETVKTLAGMSLFVIADITSPKSIPLELQATVPDYQIPFLPIIQAGERPFSMFIDLMGKYDWVLEPLEYHSLEELIRGFKQGILERALKKYQELQKRKVQAINLQSFDYYLNPLNT